MATQTEIFDLRLRLSDPPGFIAFEAVTTLPSDPVAQTAYLFGGEYKATEKTSGATPSDYEAQELMISDAILSGLLDASGEDGATCKAIKRIIAQLGSRMQIKKMQGGADSTEYQTLIDSMSYYKDLLAICSDDKAAASSTNTGRYGTTAAVEVAGGNL